LLFFFQYFHLCAANAEPSYYLWKKPGCARDQTGIVAPDIPRPPVEISDSLILLMYFIYIINEIILHTASPLLPFTGNAT